MRGDRPIGPWTRCAGSGFTPHARGSTRIFPLYPIDRTVYPACAGIDHATTRKNSARGGLPRMRGDRPSALSVTRNRAPFTPHARGSTHATSAPSLHSAVYPACAGIDLKSSPASSAWGSLPRMRGDRPRFKVPCEGVFRFTPHARGSTLRLIGLPSRWIVYPACAGIDRYHL